MKFCEIGSLIKIQRHLYLKKSQKKYKNKYYSGNEDKLVKREIIHQFYLKNQDFGVKLHFR